MSTMTQETNDFASNVASIIKTYMKLRGIKVEDAIARLHISNGTWYSHMNSGAWSMRQAAELADMLRVPVSYFYGDPDEVFNTGGQNLKIMTFDGEPEDPTPPVRPALRLV